MPLDEALARYFDALTSSIRITITGAKLQLERRRDGAMEPLATLVDGQRTALMNSVAERLGCQQNHGVFSLPGRDGETFQFMRLTPPGAQILVIKRVWDNVIRPLAEMGIEAAEAGRIRHMLRPPEGVVVVSCAWCGSLPREVASVLHEGWSGTGELGVHVADFIHWHVPGLIEMRLDSTDRPGVARVLNTVRNMELLPVVIALCDEKLALQEAFRLAQLDYRVYVVCDSRSVIDTMAWLRQRIDPWVLSEYLAGIISLRSAIGLCPHCAGPDPAPDEALLRRVGLSAAEATRLRTARGCSACENSGMAGSWLAWEMLSLRDETICPLIRGAGERELLEAVKQARGPSVEDRAREILLSGRSSLRLVEHAVFRRRLNT